MTIKRVNVIERCLAHVEKNKGRAAYNRAEYWEHRVKLMQWWLTLLVSGLTKSQNVVNRFPRAHVAYHYHSSLHPNAQAHLIL